MSATVGTTGYFVPPPWLADEYCGSLGIDSITRATAAYIRGDIELEEFERRIEALLRRS